MAMKIRHAMCYMLGGHNCSVNLRCDHCDSWSVDNWSGEQAYIEELQRQDDRKEERKSKFSSSILLGCYPDNRPVPVSECLSNVSCKQKSRYLDTQDVIVTTSPSSVKPSNVLVMSIPVSSTKLLDSYAISTGFTAEVSEPSRKCPREESASSAASHHEHS